MKNIFFLFIIISNFIYGGTHGSSPDEIWLVIVPVIILTIMLLFPFIKKKIKQMILKYRTKKEEKTMQKEQDKIVNELILIS